MRDDGPTQWPTLRELIEDLARYGDRTAVMAVQGDATTEITFADLADKSQRLASGMVASGIGPGTPVFMTSGRSRSMHLTYAGK